MCVFVSVRASKCTHTCMCNEGGTAPPGEGGSIHKREGGREGGRERDDCKDFFPFLISNLLKKETSANSFLLNLFFSVGKKNTLAKNIHSYSESGLSTSGIFFKKTFCIPFHGPVA